MAAFRFAAFSLKGVNALQLFVLNFLFECAKVRLFFKNQIFTRVFFVLP